jgi:ABC-2 type transport system ATP-binding protein
MELRDRGRTLIFSTHQMEAAEAMCESVAIVDHGRLVAGGRVRDLKRVSGRRTLRLAVEGGLEARWLTRLPDIGSVRHDADGSELELLPGADPSAILTAVLGAGAVVTRFEIVEPSLEALFIEHVGRRSNEDEARVAADIAVPSLPAGGLA